MRFQATYQRTGQDRHHHYEGTITVRFYPSLRVFEFEKIQENHWETWRESGFDLAEVPYDMRWAFLQAYGQFEDDDEDLAEPVDEDDEEDDGTILTVLGHLTPEELEQQEAALGCTLLRLDDWADFLDAL